MDSRDSDHVDLSNEKLSGEKWYPGKYLGRTARKKSTGDTRSNQNKTSSEIPVKNELLNAQPEITGKSGGFETTHYDALEVVGAVEITILEVKYLTLPRADAYIRVGPERQPFEIMGEPCTCIFSIYDIDTDIEIVIQSAGNCSQRSGATYAAVTPITSLLDSFGNVKKNYPQWRQLYPVSSMQWNSSNEIKFTCAYGEGYGMTREKNAAGFIHFSIHLQLQKSAFTLYLRPRSLQVQNKPFQFLSFNTVQSHKEGQVVSDEKKPQNMWITCQRDIDRLITLCSFPPSLLALRNSAYLPAALLLIGLITFRAAVWQIPAIIYIFVLINGVLASLRRNYSGSIIWNEYSPAVTLPSSSLSSEQVRRSESGELESITSCVMFFSRFVCCMEILANIFNFADPRASMIFYGLLAISTTICCIALRFAPRALFAMMGCSFALLFAGFHLLQHCITVKEQNNNSVGNDFARKVVYIMECIQGFLSRIPDELELMHRHIANAAIVNERGPELMDAAAAAKDTADNQ